MLGDIRARGDILTACERAAGLAGATKRTSEQNKANEQLAVTLWRALSLARTVRSLKVILRESDAHLRAAAACAMLINLMVCRASARNTHSRVRFPCDSNRKL